MRKNDETDASRLQAVPCGARVDDTQVVFVDSKRAPIPYRKHITPITEAYHVVKKRYQNLERGSEIRSLVGQGIS